MAKSITVAELITVLKALPQTYQVFTSSDPEGNNFGRLDKSIMIGGGEEDDVIILYPIEMHEYEEVFPLDDAKMMGEIGTGK